MKKILVLFFTLFFFYFPSITFSADFWRLVKLAEELNGINSGQLHDLDQLKSTNYDILKSNNSQLSSLKNILGGLTGTHTYGSNNYDPDRYNWGPQTNNWQNILSLGRSSSHGVLADLMTKNYNQFPIENRISSENKTEEEYYKLQAQTTLAARSTSELAFNQISNESNVMDKLEKEIDKAKDNKSAVDLNNRLAYEHANLSIQQAKLLATLVQQASIDSQERSNRAKEDNEFFNF